MPWHETGSGQMMVIKAVNSVSMMIISPFRTKFTAMWDMCCVTASCSIVNPIGIGLERRSKLKF